MRRVYSNYKFFGGFGLLILLNGIMGIGTYHLLTKSKINLDRVDLLNDSRAQGAYLLIIGLQLLFLTLFATQNRFIIADRDGITFINPLIPILRKTLRWTDFDYFMTVEETSRYDTHEAVWFVKNGKLAARFSSFYYSNYDELLGQVSTKEKRSRYFNPLDQLFILLKLKKIKN